MKSWGIIRLVMCAFWLGLLSPSNAATIAVDKLNLDSLTVQVTSTFPGSTSVNYDPPYVWTMGAYQGTIASGSIPLSSIGSVNYTLESTNLYGRPPSSGTVDTSLGTIDLQPADLHMTFSGLLSASFNLWNPTSTVDANSYDPITGLFSYGWSDSTQLGIFTADYSVLISGTASTVPIPQATWLFGSGLLGLAGIARRKNAT